MAKKRKGRYGTLVPWVEAPPVERGDYGVVRIVGGKYRGYLGLYDDEADNGRDVIVCPWGPPPAPSIVCRRTSIAKATPDEERRWFQANTTDADAKLLDALGIGQREPALSAVDEGPEDG